MKEKVQNLVYNFLVLTAFGLLSLVLMAVLASCGHPEESEEPTTIEESTYSYEDQEYVEAFLETGIDSTDLEEIPFFYQNIADVLYSEIHETYHLEYVNPESGNICVVYIPENNKDLWEEAMYNAIDDQKDFHTLDSWRELNGIFIINHYAGLYWLEMDVNYEE